ncbi:GIY-YIG nuclease family protein [Clostridium sp.]|uniref:GIY-YIG nuclease family protein n=1 Tax=Clostridium sp. TaxID=1506 RepID=UPI003F3984A1
MNYVYILKCSDNSLYTGWTNNLDKRYKVHSSGKGAKYTRARLPVELVYFESFEDKIEAMKREHEIKKLTRIKKLELIEKKNSLGNK